MDVQTVLESTGYAVFPIKKLDMVRTAIVWKTISERAIGSHSGYSGLKISRIQVSCFAATVDGLKTMVSAVEDVMVYKHDADGLSIPQEVKLEGYDLSTSTFYSFRDYFVV